MEPHSPTSGQLRLVVATFFFVTAFWLFLLGSSIHAALPFNPVTVPLEKKLRVKVFVPQGWKFFTKNPRDERINALAKNQHGSWISVLRGSNAGAANLFGIRRNSRAQSIELGLITSSFKEAQWTSCSERAEFCINKAPTVASITNVSPSPTLCGEIAFVRDAPVPWAWSRAKRRVIMPSKFIKVNLSCPNA
jgi:antimicrobial peptide system SdpA family protein